MFIFTWNSSWLCKKRRIGCSSIRIAREIMSFACSSQTHFPSRKHPDMGPGLALSTLKVRGNIEFAFMSRDRIWDSPVICLSFSPLLHWHKNKAHHHSTSPSSSSHHSCSSKSCFIFTNLHQNQCFPFQIHPNWVVGRVPSRTLLTLSGVAYQTLRNLLSIPVTWRRSQDQTWRADIMALLKWLSTGSTHSRS